MAMRPRTFGGANNSTGGRLRAAPARRVYEDLKPKSEWIKDQESDNLLIHLPGFPKDSLKVSTEGRNTIKVRGERLVIRNKWQRFQEDFHAPDYCNLKGTHAKFEGEILTITVPKNIITPPPKEEPKPIDKPTTSQRPPEILPAKPPQVPKDPLTQNVQETVPPKIAASKQEDKEKVAKEPNVPPKPISSVPSKVLKEPMSQKVQETVPPKSSNPNKNDQAKDFQESPVSDDTIKYGETFLNQEELPEKNNVEQKQKVGSGAPKHQETTSETKAEHGRSEMEKNKRVPELMDAEEAAKRRKIMDEENNAAKPEFVEKNIQETERNKAQKTGFVDEDKLKYRNKSATSSGTGHFGLGNFKKSVESLADLHEERKLLVNMGAAVLVFMALGAYIYHTVKN